MSRRPREWTNQTLAALDLFDPDPSTFEFDVNKIPKDQRLSDWLVGILHVAQKERAIDLNTLATFSTAFTHEGHPKKRGLNHGQPFTDTNFMAINCENVVLRGHTSLGPGGLSTDTIMASDPAFAAWFRPRGFDRKQVAKTPATPQKTPPGLNVIAHQSTAPVNEDNPFATSLGTGEELPSPNAMRTTQMAMADTAYISYFDAIKCNCQYAVGLDMQVQGNAYYASQLINDLSALTLEIQESHAATSVTTKSGLLSREVAPRPQQTPPSVVIDLTAPETGMTSVHKRSSGGSFKIKTEDLSENQAPDLGSAFSQGPGVHQSTAHSQRPIAQLPGQLVQAFNNPVAFTPGRFAPSGRRFVSHFEIDDEMEDEPQIDEPQIDDNWRKGGYF